MDFAPLLHFSTLISVLKLIFKIGTRVSNVTLRVKPQFNRWAGLSQSHQSAACERDGSAAGNILDSLAHFPGDYNGRCLWN